MKEHTIYFKFFGQKLKATFLAKDKQHALDQLYGKMEIIDLKSGEPSMHNSDFNENFNPIKHIE